jgi:hypothetical protein
MNDANLRIAIALAFFGLKRLGDGVVERSSGSDAFGPAEAGLHRPFVLVDGEETRGHATHDEPGDETDNAAEKYQAWIMHLNNSS